MKMKPRNIEEKDADGPSMEKRPEASDADEDDGTFWEWFTHEIVEGFVETLQTVQEDGGIVTQMLTENLHSPSSISFDDKELTYFLALAAFDSYDLAGKCRGRLALGDTQFQNSDNKDSILQFGVYEITDGKHNGKKILAFRGTDLSDTVAKHVTVLQDASLVVPQLPNLGRPIKDAIRNALEVALKHEPDFICGHSLGGLIAECVCSETGIPGASFNAPGPWSSLPLHNLLSGDKYNGVKFEVHLTRNDPVSLFGGMLGVAISHVGKPIWHPGVGTDHVIDNHKIELMVTDLEKDL